MTIQAVRELPRYKCHKEVWALKIASIEVKSQRLRSWKRFFRNSLEPELTVGAMITPMEPGYAPLPVSHAFMVKHDPQPGGYYVVYKDGYQSFSPAETFEDGYTRI